MILIKNASVYSPEKTGTRDILVGGAKILAIGPDITIPEKLTDFVINGENLFTVPGFIDAHVHITGGGGEGGFITRAPELMPEEMVQNGVTTCVGCLGTDGVTRSMENLIAKAYQIEQAGLTCYAYSGSYRVPPVSLTGSIINDIVYIPNILGIGEIAISDHRSSQPGLEDIKKIAADARLGGILSGKAGLVNLHMGDGKAGLSMIFTILENSEIPVTQFYPTHMSRNKTLFSQGMEFIKAGGIIDFTASSKNGSSNSAVQAFLESRNLGYEDSVTFTSDAHGSLPVFNEKKELIKMDTGKMDSLQHTFRTLVLQYDIPLETALKPFTVNPAKILKLNNKARLLPGYDADIVLYDKELNPVYVVAKGKILKKP